MGGRGWGFVGFGLLLFGEREREMREEKKMREKKEKKIKRSKK